jgi:hypothetical protein
MRLRGGGRLIAEEASTSGILHRIDARYIDKRKPSGKCLFQLKRWILSEVVVRTYNGRMKREDKYRELRFSHLSELIIPKILG